MHLGLGSLLSRSLALIGAYFPYPTFFTTNFLSSRGNTARTFWLHTPAASAISRGPTGTPAPRIASKITRCLFDMSQ